jgi:polysaccharide export outer membrane protein
MANDAVNDVRMTIRQVPARASKLIPIAKTCRRNNELHGFALCLRIACCIHCTAGRTGGKGRALMFQVVKKVPSCMVDVWSPPRRGGPPALVGPLVLVGMAALASLLAGCASLPVSGPTGSQVIRATVDGKDPAQLHLVEVVDPTALPPPLPLPAIELPRLPPPPSDTIGQGDVLDISVYEAGVALFAGSGARAGGMAGTGAQTVIGGAQAEHLPSQRVDDAGYIRVPYAGRLRAAGHTPEELALMIGKALHGMSQNPQVSVSIVMTIANSVIVGGEVAKPGRLVLNTNREVLSDVVALSGGYRGDAKDLSVRVTRKDGDFEYRMSDVLDAGGRDVPVVPGDRIEVLRKPRTFAVMGASGKVEHMSFSAAQMSLAEAVASAGGARGDAGNAKAIFVFRYVPTAEGGEQATVYHVNMMKPGAYVLSQRFAMRDKDVLYVGNAAANQASKLVGLIGQLFSPVLSAAVVAQQATN